MFTELKMKKYAIYLLGQFNLLDCLVEGKSVYNALIKFIDKGSIMSDPEQELDILRNDIITLGKKTKPGFVILTYKEHSKSNTREAKIDSIVDGSNQ